MTLFTFAMALLFLAGDPQLPGAIITEDTEVFRLNSATSGDLTVSKTIQVLDKRGEDAALFYEQSTTFYSLKSFSGYIQSGNGKPHKIKKDDLYSTSFSENLIDDARTYAYSPDAHYPYTVHYEYKIGLQKGIGNFPTFFPVDSDEVLVESASYTVDVPEGFPIKYVSSRMEYSQETKGGRDLHRWSVKDVQPIADEALAPSYRSLVPYVYSSPEEINLSGYKGMQRNWKEVGDWLWQLQEGTGELTQEEIGKVQELTAGCKTDCEKLALLYGYLRNKTRYVSIQLGIGGWKPMLSKDVSRLGYGDCKGLSKYMQSLLAAVGIKSDYYIINTNMRDLLPGYASNGQMNHAMLAVPMPELSDTVWVECTNPAYPLGYRHSSAAGHEVVLVKEEGGELVRIPSYADTLSLQRQYSDVVLTSGGTALLTMRRELYLDQVESYLNFRELREDEKKQKLTSGMKGSSWELEVTGVSDNFADYPTRGHGYVPEMSIEYNLLSGGYANANGNRIFVPVNPYPKMASIQKKARQNDVVLKMGGRREDIITLHIPDGYTVESLPKNVNYDTEWGSFVSQADLSEDGKTLVIKQTVTQKRFNKPASEYSKLADFFRKINRQYSGSVVLTLQP